MDLIALSDPHTDINSARNDKSFISSLMQYINNLEGDILLITGDIAGSTKELIRFFKESTKLNVKYKLFVPGNHDVWVNKDFSNGSEIKYLEILPEIARQFNWHYLPETPFIIDNISIIGEMGWYDYSTRNMDFDNIIDFETYANKINPKTNSTWMDKHFANFGIKSDQEITDFFVQRMTKHLQNINVFTGQNQHNTNIDTVVIGSHFVPFIDFVTHINDLSWDYFSAFIGSIKIGNCIEKINPIYRRIAIFGHTHHQKIKINQDIEKYCVPIGYPHEYGETKPLDEVFNNHIKIINV
ncbi:MAG: metallophosphoesterase [Candidatus Heimdallarchaeota archaeon]|nr:metallophosphoesterase [Candidatus Heimdallarchaeota archaeon]MDH5646408.1 metallophosphoesterase [Candidatus Heimdallarchaeota archaeon]